MLAACQPYQYKGTILSNPKPLTDFTLSSADGSEFRLSTFDKPLLVLYFGYTHCPDVCPATMAQLRLAAQQLGDKARSVQVAFVTVDPQRDTPERLKEFLGNFDPSFIGLYTTDAAALRAITQQFGLYYEDQGGGSQDPDYLVAHTSSILVIKDSKLIAVFPGETSGADIAADLEHLLAH